MLFFYYIFFSNTKIEDLFTKTKTFYLSKFRVKIVKSKECIMLKLQLLVVYETMVL